MIFNLYMYMLMILSLNFMILSIIFILIKEMIFIEWLIYSINSCDIEFIIFIDWMMLMFMSVVMFISSMVMLYSKEYMMMDLKKKYFIMILMLFVISMIFMIISPNIISIILGWDGLGLISYCLIIYYQNVYSYNSGMLTLLTNRIGDCMLLMMIFMMINLGSWNLLFFNFNNKLFIIMFLIMIMTKSAQIPFSMWLPAAMAAPTPVSSLVHSSTLVTAGIYLLIRFNNIFMLNNMNLMIMYIGLMTMLVSSMNALMEFDFKKIIAFSTLSQLGLMMLMLSLNLTNYVFFHLISHAMFKSLLFLCSGVMIHFMSGVQDIRFMGSLINEVPLVIMYFNFSNLSLCGFPFLSGFYSKDLLYEMSLNLNLNKFIYYFMYLCIMLTMMYTFRLMYYLILNYNMYYTLSMKFDSFVMNLSMFMLFLMSVIFGSLINWLLFSSLSLSIINFKIKLNLYIMMFLSVLIILVMKFINFNYKLMFNKLINILSMFFYLLKLTMMNNLSLLQFSKLYLTLSEISWNEFYSKMMMMFLMNKINLIFINLYMNKFMMMILMFIYLYLFFYILM
nr:NADH dehydrogenase subunit 5 [Andricus mairei]UZI00103.1 NADH dehydrogenase subunit 5 [Andricus mairei]UZN92494.1 NADH dehydrogenase subunit 5 [Andricus mairei]UZN92520.1 NADH dehydrogenase subunit 5 [Andricus mairei]